MSLRGEAVAIDLKGRCEGEARGKPTKSLRAPKGRGNLYNKTRLLHFVRNDNLCQFAWLPRNDRALRLTNCTN